mmetsp:Transcript_18727/g.45070  ORF Transcript_18727/g.45070 Transcript_18727/m.45070 type:complete len:254 (+) Transcript_18727:2875-3636(+)
MIRFTSASYTSLYAAYTFVRLSFPLRAGVHRTRASASSKDTPPAFWLKSSMAKRLNAGNESTMSFAYSATRESPPRALITSISAFPTRYDRFGVSFGRRSHRTRSLKRVIASKPSVLICVATAKPLTRRRATATSLPSSCSSSGFMPRMSTITSSMFRPSAASPRTCTFFSSAIHSGNTLRSVGERVETSRRELNSESISKRTLPSISAMAPLRILFANFWTCASTLEASTSMKPRISSFSARNTTTVPTSWL